MTKRTAFALGWLGAASLNRAVMHVVRSDTNLGKECREKLLSRLDHNQLLRIEEEVQEELIRRSKSNRSGATRVAARS